MRTRRWIVVGLVLTAGCASGVGGGSAGEGGAALPVGGINEDGEFVSESLGYALRPPAGWTLAGTQVEGAVTAVALASPADQSGIWVSVGPPTAGTREALDEDLEQGLEDLAEQIAEGDESRLDPESGRTIELSSGQPAVVMNVTPEGDRTGGRVLVTYANELLYTLTMLLGPDLPDFDDEADAVVESFRILD